MLLTKIPRNVSIWHLTFIYFNNMSPSFEFRVIEDIPLVVLKSKLDNLLCYPNNRKVVKIEYHSPLIDNQERLDSVSLS